MKKGQLSLETEHGIQKTNPLAEEIPFQIGPPPNRETPFRSVVGIFEVPREKWILKSPNQVKTFPKAAIYIYTYTQIPPAPQ